jgi:hypothetical protein
MEVQIASLCDSAADYDGKLCVLGCFDTIYARQFPATHPQCSVALRLLFRKEEEGRRRVRINFIDEDGHSVIPPLDTEIEVALTDDALFATRNLVLNLQQLRFSLPGQYSVDVSVDDQIATCIPLKVRDVSGQPGLN